MTERRLNFLPPYPNWLVLITPPQAGVFADTAAPRGRLVDHLHPLYENILKEIVTDGRSYLSSDGRQTYAADEHYEQVEAAIQAGAKQLPLTVCGEVAWVCAQMAPTHLRLTVVDGGYVNPDDRTAAIDFHTVTPTGMVDPLTGSVVDASGRTSVNVDVPCGLFRFIDVELKEPL